MWIFHSFFFWKYIITIMLQWLATITWRPDHYHIINNKLLLNESYQHYCFVPITNLMFFSFCAICLYSSLILVNWLLIKIIHSFLSFIHEEHFHIFIESKIKRLFSFQTNGDNKIEIDQNRQIAVLLYKINFIYSILKLQSHLYKSSLTITMMASKILMMSSRTTLLLTNHNRNSYYHQSTRWLLFISLFISSLASNSLLNIETTSLFDEFRIPDQQAFIGEKFHNILKLFYNFFHIFLYRKIILLSNRNSEWCEKFYFNTSWLQHWF